MRPPAGSARRCAPDITISAFTRPARSAVSAPPPPAPGSWVSTPRPPRRALGIAGTQASGLKSQFGTMCKPFHAGKASQNGLLGGTARRTRLFEPARPRRMRAGFCPNARPRFPPRGGARRSAGRVPHPGEFVQVPRRLLSDARPDRSRPRRPRPARRRARADRAGQAEARPQLRPGLQHPVARPTGSRRNSACARPSRWRWPASIPRASPPTAPPRPTTLISSRCATRSPSISRTAGRKPPPRSKSR